MSEINLNHTTPAAPGGNTNVTWQVDSSNNVSGYVPNSTSPLTTKGDIWGYDTTDDRIPVGSDGQVLTADSGVPLGVSWQTPSGGSIGVQGTAVFSASGGTISGLVTAGCVTGVTRNSTGNYSVTLTSPPSNYIVMLSGGDNTNLVILQVDPVSSYGSSGFTFVCNTTSGAFDPGLLFVSIIGA